MEGQNKTKEVIFRRKKHTFSKIIYFIFVGLWASIINIIVGIVLCCTLIFIPFGIVYFKALPLVAFPQDKIVVTHFEHYPFKNPLWLVCGGLLGWIINRIGVIILYAFVITIPLAKQLSKISSYFLSPFGAEILRYGEVSYQINTKYEVNLITNRIVVEALKDRKSILNFIHQNRDIIKANRLKSKGNVKSLSGIILYYSLYLFKDYFDSKGKYYIDNLKQRSFGANLYYADKNTYFKQNSIDYKKGGLVKVKSYGTTRTWSLNELFAEGLNEDYKEE